MEVCRKNSGEREKTRGAVDLLPLLLLGFITLTTILVVGSVQKQQELRGKAQVYPCTQASQCLAPGSSCCTGLREVVAPECGPTEVRCLPPLPTPLPSPTPISLTCVANGNYCIPSQEFCDPGDLQGAGGTCGTGEVCCQRGAGPRPTPLPSPSPSTLCIDNAGKCVPNSHTCRQGGTIVGTLPYTCPTGVKCVGETTVCVPPATPLPTPFPSPSPLRYACQTNGQCTTTTSTGPNTYATQFLCVNNCFPPVTPPPSPSPSTACLENAGRCWPNTYLCNSSVILPYSCPTNQKCVSELTSCYPRPSATPTPRPSPSPVCTSGSCFYGYSTCANLGRYSGSGTCWGGICCGNVIPQPSPSPSPTPRPSPSPLRYACQTNGQCTTTTSTGPNTYATQFLCVNNCFPPVTPRPTPRASPSSVCNTDHAAKCVPSNYTCTPSGTLTYTCPSGQMCVGEAAICQPKPIPSSSPRSQTIIPAKCTLSSGEEVPVGTRRCSINTYLRMADRGPAGETLMECSATGEWEVLQNCRIDIGEKCTIDVCSSGTVCEANVACIDTLNVTQAPVGSHSCLGSRGDQTQVMKYCCLGGDIFDDSGNPTRCYTPPKSSPSPRAQPGGSIVMSCLGWATCDSVDPKKMHCDVNFFDPLKTILNFALGSNRTIDCSPNTCKQTSPLSASCTGPAPASSSFLAGILIDIPGGSMPIEQVNVGQKVLAFDPVTKSLKPETVEKTYTYESEDYYIVKFLNGTILNVTGRHPLYIGPYYVSSHIDILTGEFQAPGFEQVQYLKAGDKIYTLPDNFSTQTLTQQTTITSTEEVNQKVQVYNLAVSGSRTYFAQSVAVHNKAALDTVTGCTSETTGEFYSVGERRCIFNDYPRFNADRGPATPAVQICTAAGMVLQTCNPDESCLNGVCSKNSPCEAVADCIDSTKVSQAPLESHSCWDTNFSKLKYCCVRGKVFDNLDNPILCGPPSTESVPKNPYCGEGKVEYCQSLGLAINKSWVCKPTPEGGTCCDPALYDCSANASPLSTPSPRPNSQTFFQCHGTCEAVNRSSVLNCKYVSFLPFTYRHTCENNRTCTGWGGDLIDCSGPAVATNDAAGTIQDADYSSTSRQPSPAEFPVPPSFITCDNGYKSTCNIENPNEITCLKTSYSPFWPLNPNEVTYTINCGDNTCKNNSLTFWERFIGVQEADCGGTPLVPTSTSENSSEPEIEESLPPPPDSKSIEF